ncbi:hypothetical protein TRFO_27602 [Tritrichomonas foetus]|uniref:Uncharacterized protein n=1 Tax=Tritrichomonas foetus TaxID=1144522 RepID=A0A1J4K1I2_9EUKA|nr:hypothetical protein TRFO_27602 [Tritrichomonas foetus]|eukprot:OHT04818.1 hypothetical protein TRFO_27602 [Tritrichomonas foetus]
MNRKKYRLPPVYWIIVTTSIFAICLVNIIMLSMSSTPSNCNCPKCDSISKIKYNSIDEITFITCPRPLSPDKYNSMKLALSSWLAASPKSRILLFVNRSEFDPSDKLPTELDQLFGPGRITYAPSIRHDHKNVPYIDDWFRQGIKQSESKYVSFINSDIPISNDWLRRVKQVFQVMNDKPAVLIGQRIDFDLIDDKFNQLRFDQKHLLKDIDKMVQESPHSDHSPFGIDSFTFRIDSLPFDFEKIPPFIMGRYNWDNWIIGWLNQVAETVTFNLNPPIYHINHKRHNFDPNDDKVAVNHHFKKANKDYFGSNYDTKWEVVDNNLVRRHFKNVIKLPNI